MLTSARAAAGLDSALSTTTHVQYSEDGSAQSTVVAAIALTGSPVLSAATSANPSVKGNTDALESPAATGSATIGYWRFASASSGSGTTGWNPLGTYRGRFAVLAATDVFWCPEHGFTDTDLVQLVSIAGATGVVAATGYYVRDASANTFKLAATSGGTAINITADGVGGIVSWAPVAVVEDETLTHAAGVLQERLRQ